MEIKPIEPETDVIAMIHRMGGATQGHPTPPHMETKRNFLVQACPTQEGSWFTVASRPNEDGARVALKDWRKARPEYMYWRIAKETVTTTREVIS